MPIGLIALVALFAILYGLDYLGRHRKLQEGFQNPLHLTSANRYQQLHKNYHDALELARTHKLQPGDQLINKLQPASSNLVGQTIVGQPIAEQPSAKASKCKWHPGAILQRVASLQPPHLGKNAVIVKGEYYYDRRFQNAPVHIDFAMDPDAYARDHPFVYPSYVWGARVPPS